MEPVPANWPEPGFPTEWVEAVRKRYRVTPDLRVLRQDGKELRQTKKGQLKLHYEGREKKVMVTKLSLTSFKPDCMPENFYKSEMHADHIENRGQGGAHHVDNLQWLGRAEHARKSNEETRRNRKSNAGAQSKAIRVVESPVPEHQGKEFASIQDASRQLGLDPGSVSKACRNVCKTEGYKFEYVFQPDLPDEIWNWSETFQVKASNRGRVMTPRGIKTTGYQTLHGTPSKSSYIRIRRKTVLMHRVIADAFLGPCPEGMNVLHDDSNPLACVNGRYRNWIEDLRYGTQSENIREYHRAKKMRTLIE